MDAVHDIASTANHQQAIQIEAIVEELQKQLWGGSFDLDVFLDAVHGACAARGQPPLNCDGMDVLRNLYQSALHLNAIWQEILFYCSLKLDFNPRVA